MKKSIVLFFVISVFAACQNKTNANKAAAATTETTAEPIVGNDTDEHGCKPSTGYQWSVIRGECVRVFEIGIPLDAKAKGLNNTLVAFVVFKSNGDDAQAELFVPTDTKSILLTKDTKEGAGEWKNDAYTLKQWKGMYSLEDNKKTLLYQGAAAK
jgi:hypothetical protein